MALNDVPRRTASAFARTIESTGRLTVVTVSAPGLRYRPRFLGIA